MFERKKFKAAALQQLKGRWSIPVWTLILTYLIGAIIMLALTFSGRLEGVMQGISNHRPAAIAIFYIIVILIWCFMAAFGLAYVSLLNTMYKEERKVYFSDFIKGLNQWWQAIRGLLWYMLFVFLWYLLFIIPGLIKAIEYSMMFPVMAEYPKISVRKAMRISKELTRGYKGDLFVLGLSFIGWVLLAYTPYLIGLGIVAFAGSTESFIVVAIIAAIVGMIIYIIALFFLTTYMYMTFMNAYHYLKQTAIDSNRLSPEDFE